ncbi:MAG: hypothetical protein DME22_22400 [Verrucomicrobia bacterium]|nr:MAG: hypothetical protein DME22_22400 [Verrucomicrobiota bacterium]PYK01289.1 MAG: hypothetical protein DME23_04440 [Verrucomicrobiota bacterium]
MNKRSWTMLVVVVGLVGGTSSLLGYWKTNQRLGRPAVKVVPQATFDWQGNVVATNSVYLPERVLDYESSVVSVTKQEVAMLPKDTTYGRRVYKAPDGLQIWCNAILMGTDRTSIHKPEYCLPGQGWAIDARRKEQTSILIDRPYRYELPVMKWIVNGVKETTNGQKAEVRGVYVFWFVADNELATSHLKRFLLLSRDLFLRGVLQRWTYVSYFSVCYPGQEEDTYQRIKAFIGATVPEFQLATGAVSSEILSVAPPESR